MALEAGEPVLGKDLSESRDGDASVAAGDAVTLSGGSMAAAGDTDEFGGIARHAENNDGRGNTNILTGAVVANVASGTSEGARLDTSATAGELAASSGGPVLALSDEGGTWHGANGTYDVPAGYAVVYY